MKCYWCPILCQSRKSTTDLHAFWVYVYCVCPFVFIVLLCYRCIVSLMNIPVESECLHAALRLILRLTRNHQNAMLFAELGGPRILLTLTQSSSFPGFISLASLIFRHIIEEPSSLRYCMEKVKHLSVVTLSACIQEYLRDFLSYTIKIRIFVW